MASPSDDDKPPGPTPDERVKQLSDDRQQLYAELLKQARARAKETVGAPPSPPPPSPPPPSPPPPEPAATPPGAPPPQDPWQAWTEWQRHVAAAQAAQGGPPQGARPAAQSLFALKPGGSLPPLFLASPIYGSVFPYHHLVLHLDPEQPVYGLQSPAFDGVTPAHQTLQEQARDYIAAMKRVQRAGPYHVGGYSFGGWTAFEMARQLLAAGERVAFLGILGTTPPPSLAAPMQAKVMEHVWDLSDAQARLARDTGIPEEQRVAAQRVPGAAVGTPLQRIALANTLAALRYVPGPIECELSLFATMDFLSRSQVDRTMGWWLLSTRDIDVQIHDGTHQTCLSDPHVRDLANKLSARLKVVRAR